MPIPTTVADLSTTASSNSPAGSESPNQLDDYHRALCSIVRQVSDAKADTGHTQASNTISDSTAAGRALLTAADAAAQRTALGLTSAATTAVGTAANNLVQLTAAAKLPAVDGSLLTGIVTSVGQHMVRLNTLNGYGSTNTKICRFSTTVTNAGSSITYADSATLGASFTIGTSGVYSVSISGGSTISGCFIGSSLNTTTPTLSIQNCGLGEILADSYCPVNAVTSASWTGYLTAGDVVRPHADGSTLNTSVVFTIVRVS